MCGKELTVYVGINYDRAIKVKCGNTSPHGTPWLCDECEAKHEGRNWRREAEEAGEQWDADY